MTHIQTQAQMQMAQPPAGMLAEEFSRGRVETDEQAFLNHFLGSLNGRRDSAATPVSHPARHALFFDGDEAERFYVVRSGVVCAYRLLNDGRRHIFRFFAPGDIIGLTLDDGYSYCAETVTGTSLESYRRSDLSRSMAADTKLSRRVLDLAFDELRLAQDQMLLLGRKTAVERVASFLVAMARKNLEGCEVEGDGMTACIRVPMPRADIADYLGLTLETVCRAISTLKRDGMIQLLKGHRIEITAPEALADVAGGDDL